MGLPSSDGTLFVAGANGNHSETHTIFLGAP